MASHCLLPVPLSRYTDGHVVCAPQLFTIVIFGSIANEGYVNRPEELEEHCIFNRNQNACNYAVAMGTLAFLCCAAFLVLDAYFPQISSVKDRKKAVLADIGVSGEAGGHMQETYSHGLVSSSAENANANTESFLPKRVKLTSNFRLDCGR